MDKFFELIIVLFFTSFINYEDPAPRLTELKIDYDYDECSAPIAIFDIKLIDNILSFSFGQSYYLEKQDTISFSFKKDSLFITIIKRNKTEVVVRNGKTDTVNRRDDPECECNSLINVKFSGVSKTPKYFVINNCIHDDNLGLVDVNKLKYVRDRVRTQEITGNFKLDSLFEVKPQFKGYPVLSDLPYYLRKKGTIALVVIDADTPSEKLLVGRIQRELMKKSLICETRTQISLQKSFIDKDSVTVWLKLTDTKNFKFPEYRKRK